MLLHYHSTADIITNSSSELFILSYPGDDVWGTVVSEIHGLGKDKDCSIERLERDCLSDILRDQPANEVRSSLEPLLTHDGLIILNTLWQDWMKTARKPFNHFIADLPGNHPLVVNLRPVLLVNSCSWYWDEQQRDKLFRRYPGFSYEL